jgi:hypothetical protein
MLYVPILKAKEGEYAGLGVLGLDVRHRITPLLEVPGIPYDYLKDKPARTLDLHVQGIASKVKQSWGEDRQFYIDLSAHNSTDLLENGTHALNAVLEEARAVGVKAIPVIYTWSSDDCLEAAALHSRQTDSGACVRLTLEDFDEEVDLEDRLDRVTNFLGLSNPSIDLLLDLKEIQGDVQRSVLLVRALMVGVPEPSSWRNVILAASSFPEDLRDVEAATVSTMPRKEWELWGALQKRPERLPRRDLVFSDYGITHPTLKELDPRMITMSASIRYTTSDKWIVVKGRNVRQHGFDQYYTLCEKLISHPAYAGSEFSWGDRYIAETAARKTGPGNATTWRKVGTNHHITLTAIQLSTSRDS